LRRIGATVRGITSEQLHVRLAAETVPIELDPLVAAFNDMLDQLQRSFTRLANFSADIAHELRTPVTNLTTQTQVALTKARDTEAYREVLYSGLEELDRMRKMIGDMLFLAQADHRLSTAEMSEVDLGAEVLALFDYLEAWAEDLGLSLQLEGALTVAGDRLMLRRAISNLLTNALRYTPRGERITVQLSQHGAMAEIRVRNPGPVIDAQHLEQLFDRFYRVDPSRHRAGEGAGLGLAIVRSIAEAHGGRVGVESADGVTSFWLRFPANADVAAEPVPAPGLRGAEIPGATTFDGARHEA
jgi:two-component system heavy metal sensor histidine kinase CusS